MDIEIKQIQVKEQYQLISKFMHELHQHEHEMFDKTADWSDIEQSYMRHIMTMQAESEGVCLVAYKEGVAAGFMFGYIEEQDDSRIEVYKGKELYVSDGYISREFRRMGIYRKLNEEMERIFIANGIQRITRYTQFNNVRMRQFLEEEGYIVTRLLYEKWLE